MGCPAVSTKTCIAAVSALGIFIFAASCSAQLSSTRQATQSPEPPASVERSCPVSEPYSDFWEATGSVAGQFPVWMTSAGRGNWDESRLGPVVLPPIDAPGTFMRGHLVKTLVFVDKSVDGDLVVTGRRLEDGTPIYFHDDTNSERVDNTTLRLLSPPPTSVVIPHANITNRSPNPPGMATHGIGPIYTGHGCWQFTFDIAGHETVISLRFSSDSTAP